MIKGAIVDGETNTRLAKVDENGSLTVHVDQHPEHGELKTFPYRSYLTLNGDGTTIDMRVNGSVTNQAFYITATNVEDIFIEAASFIIADAGASLSSFGAAAALTNGCVFQWITAAATITLHPALKSNWDFVRMCSGNPPFGSGADAFRGTNVVGLSEAYIPTFDFQKLIPPYGLRLQKGTKDKLVLTIRDNLSTLGLDQVDTITLGFTHIE